MSRRCPTQELALGEADVVATQVPVAADSSVAGCSLAELQLDIEPGFQVLAVRRDNRYIYRPRGSVVIEPLDELIASGPQEGRVRLAELCGWAVVEDEDDPTGEFSLVPLSVSRSGASR